MTNHNKKKTLEIVGSTLVGPWSRWCFIVRQTLWTLISLMIHRPSDVEPTWWRNTSPEGWSSRILLGSRACWSDAVRTRVLPKRCHDVTWGFWPSLPFFRFFLTFWPAVPTRFHYNVGRLSNAPRAMPGVPRGVYARDSNRCTIKPH